MTNIQEKHTAEENLAYLVNTFQKRKEELIKEPSVQKELLKFENKDEALNWFHWLTLPTLYYTKQEAEDILNNKQKQNENFNQKQRNFKLKS